MFTKSNNWLIWVLAGVLVGVVGWVIWKDYFKPVERAGETVAATPAKEVANLPTVAAPIAGGAVQAYPKAVKRKLKLPKTVVEDESKVVVSSSKVAASERSHTVTTLVDTNTGKAEAYVRADPLPWLAYTTRGSAGTYYGFKRGEQTVRLQVQQDIVQMKALTFGVTASVDRSVATGLTDSFIGVGAAYRW